jgi:hypothetical protein
MTTLYNHIYNIMLERYYDMLLEAAVIKNPSNFRRLAARVI